MGFDNECILNIQSLAGEYFCPVCRTLVYPHEALQTQCTHLYCKPCLSYIVSSTQACPYDGYLVTEAGSKPLMESNKALAETIGKTTVHCLYHRSGCVWQGPLAECTAHCSGCAFGNSPVVCNKCGIQIVHRQVQEHAQSCNVNGTNAQPLGSETAQGAATTDQSKVTTQAAAPPPASQPPTTHTAVVPTSVNQPVAANPIPQVMPAPAVPTLEMQYYQQYQQYYQQYPGYDPYQQSYQQYYPYQQQPAQQVQQLPPQLQPQVQQQVQAPMPQVQPPAQNQPTAQTQSQGPPQPQPQPQTHPQASSQVPANGQPQPLYPQAAVVGSSQNQGQVSLQPQGQPVAHGQMPLQYSQIQPHVVQSYALPPMQPPPYQQPHSQMHHLQPSQGQQYPQTQPQPQSYPQPPPHFQPHPLPQSQPQPQLQPIRPQLPPAGHPSYQSQPHQQIQHAQPQQQPMQAQPPSGSLPPNPLPPPHMQPPQPSHAVPPQQRPVMHQAQQPAPPQYMQHPQAYPGQVSGQPQGQPHHTGSFAHQNPQVRPQAPPQPMQQPSLGFVQPQQVNALPHGMPPQNYAGRPDMMSQGGPQHYPQSFGPAGVAPPARPSQVGPSQPSGNQSNVNSNNQPQVYSDQLHNQSSSLKKSESMINDVGANSKEVKLEAGMSNEFKPEDGKRKDGALVKDAVSELHQVQGVPGDSASTHRLKEENKDNVAAATTDSAKQGDINVNFQGSSQADSGPFSQSQTAPKGQLGDMSGGLPRKGTEQSSHPPVPYGLTGQQQRPVTPVGQSPNQLRPPGQGYLPHGPHPGEQFQPHGPNQSLPLHPEGPSGGPNSRGYEQHSAGQGKISRMSQGDPLGPPMPLGPDGQPAPCHPGPMESDMHQHQRPFDSRQDSHLPGNLDRGPYGPPYGAESNPARMNGAPASGYDEKFRTADNFPIPTRHREETIKQFPAPPQLGSEDNPKFGSHLSRPSSGYGMDGPPRFYDKDPHGYGYDAGHRLPPYHPNEAGGRLFPPSIHDDNRGRFDNNRQNPDFLGPMHGFGRHHIGRLPPTGPGNPFGGPHNIDVDGRNIERQPFGERFPMGPPGHMHRGEFDGPGKPRNGEFFGPRNLPGRGEPGFGPIHDYGRLGELIGPGGFSHQPRFGEPFGSKSARPHFGEPGFRSGYPHRGFPSDVGFYEGGPDSFDPIRKRKTLSAGWCRICKVDCESVEGLEVHGQTRDHQRMSMDMVISIKKKNAERHKKSVDREEVGKLRNTEMYARANMS